MFSGTLRGSDKKTTHHFTPAKEVRNNHRVMVAEHIMSHGIMNRQMIVIFSSAEQKTDRK